MLEPLPIDAVLPELVGRVREAGAAVLIAPTGAGKTTRVPPALLRHDSGRILLVEPRRVAARAAARRMAHELGGAVGGVVGYHVRFENQTSTFTRIVAVTPGILLRYLQADPFLESISAVVFDEFHERGLETDLALGLVKLLRATVRPDLAVVVMSATLDPGPVADYLGGCPSVVSAGRSYPVTVTYRPRVGPEPWAIVAARAAAEVAATTRGDVLVFLPGVREIRDCLTQLDGLTHQHDMLLLPLYGDMPPAEQDRALQAHRRRKIVVATNVAETSVTVAGITAVIDSGVARQLEFDPGLGLDRLVLGPISQAAADQRAGRAGRTQPGVCVRLWEERTHRARPGDTVPEVRRVDLAGAVLMLAALREPHFEWLESPRPDSLARAQATLAALGAVELNGTLTALGERLAALPCPPRVGRLLLEAEALGGVARAALAAALLTERDGAGATGSGGDTTSDLLDRVQALEAGARGGRVPPSAEAVVRTARQFQRLVTGAESGSEDDLLRAIAAAYPDRIARRRSVGDSRARLVGGRGVRLAPQSGVREAELFACVDLSAGETESIVRMASAVRREWLDPAHLSTRHEINFDPESEKLTARKVTRYFDLILEDAPGQIPDESAATAVLLAAVQERLERVQPAPESAAGQLLARLEAVRGWMPDAGWPSAAELVAGLLPELCRGRRSLADVQKSLNSEAIFGQLSYEQRQRLDRDAPATVTVPGGTVVRVKYEPGRPPILAARIQDLFGLAETPRVAGGRVKVVVHLLAPNGRPQQVTDDLASFWRSGYAQVRKELRGRYPKQAWPEQPTVADATRRPKPRPPGQPPR